MCCVGGVPKQHPKLMQRCARPLLTRMRMCKKEGWRELLGFCRISFVPAQNIQLGADDELALPDGHAAAAAAAAALTCRS